MQVFFLFFSRFFYIGLGRQKSLLHKVVVKLHSQNRFLFRFAGLKFLSVQIPSIDKSIHGRIRVNFAIDCVTFAPCTSLYTSFKCLVHGKIYLFPAL